MKHTLNIPGLAAALALGAALGLAPARAQTYDLQPSYTAANPADTIYSYDWDSSGNLYYGTEDSYMFDGLYEDSNGTTSEVVTPTGAFAGAYAGASVVAVGNYVYFNTSDIYAYNTTSGTTADVSSASNYGLYGHNGSLYITAPATSGNQISQAALNSATGAFSGTPLAFEADSANSGPLSFDAEGDLIYAPGFGLDQILEWSAADVAKALAGTMTLTPGNGTVLYDYTSTYGQTEGGATSMLIVGNQLFVTLTYFGAPSDLLEFTLNADGSLAGGADLAYSSETDALGELRDYDGNIYVSDGANIDQLVAAPEPSTWALLGLGAVGMLISLRRRKNPAAALAAAALLAASVPAMAGPFSPDGDQPGSNGVPTDDPNIVEWANGYENFDPGPTDIAVAGSPPASYGSPSDALGPATATLADPSVGVVSLGDGGSITLTFAQPIANGPGADFAVFENGFPEAGVANAYFLELATVSVSSDGVNFFTFPSVSLTQTATQVGAFGTLDPTNLYNLAGSEIAGYGTPFDLSDLAGTVGLNINDIIAVKITDVIGNVNTSLGAGTYTYDDASNPIFGGKYGTTNNLINDPFPTNFDSSGFDLDAVAVLNVASPEPATWALLAAGLALGVAARRLKRT